MTLPDTRANAWIELALRAIPVRELVALLRAFGSPGAVLAASRARLAAVVPESVVVRIVGEVDPTLREACSGWLAEPRHEWVAWGDPDYPAALLSLADPPAVIFLVGRRDLLNRPALAIVGSRNATPQGRENARAFARTLSGAGLAIVSGLAIGVDGAAHEGALEAEGSTIAVVGTGLDRVYPRAHRDLARIIGERGTLLSEFLPGTPPLAANFPRRNRLISGLARGVLVVEATLSSGSLLTARCAAEQGREVFAIPGSIHSPFSKGPHRLIREGAKLVETAQDVLDELALPAGPLPPPAPGVRPRATTPAQQSLLSAMGHDPAAIDQLASRSGLAPEAIAALLVELELAGRIASLPGGRWQRVD